MDRDEAIEILKLALDDIARMKHQQWRDFYATLAVQAGLLVLFKDHIYLRALFIFLALLAGIMGSLLVRTAQRSLEKKFRERKNRALEYLGKEFIDMWGGQDPPDRGRDYPNTLLLVLGIGTAVTILVMLKFPPPLF